MRTSCGGAAAARSLFGTTPGREGWEDAAGLLRALRLRSIDDQPLPSKDWLPLRMLAGESGCEETLLVEATTGESLVLVARAGLFADPLDADRRFVLSVAQPSTGRQEAVTAESLSRAN